MMSKKLFSSICYLSLLALTSTMAMSLHTPRLYGWGAVNGKVFGYGDLMLPFVNGDDSNTFIDGIAKAGDDSGNLFAIGGGHRQVLSNGNLVGVYVLADRTKVNHGQSTWGIHPGVEGYNGLWDGHLNGYFPFNDRKMTASNQSVTLFYQHQQYLGQVNQYNQFAKGVDGIVGRRLPNFRNSRLYGAGFYYSYKDISSIRGIEVGIETPLTSQISVLVRDSYDNQHKNELSVGISVSLGDMPEVQKKSGRDHLLDPLRHYMGTLNTGTGTPVRDYQQVLRETLIRDNIWFFDPMANNSFNVANGVGNCTFENPCSGNDFNQANLDTINGLVANPNFYVNSGAINFSGQYLDIANGANIFGRTNNFHTAATGASRPIFNGTFLVNGNNQLHDFVINGTNVTLPGFGTRAWAIASPASASGNIDISNVMASATSTDVTAFGAEFRGGDIVITNSTFNGSTSSATDDFAIGLSLTSGVTTTSISNSSFNASNSGAQGRAQGITIAGNNVATINDSIINVNNQNGTTSVSDNSTIGIFLQDNATATINRSVITTNQGGGLRDLAGIKTINSSSAIINSSTLSVSATQPAQDASATNISAGTTVTINNSTITVTNPGGTAQLNQNQAAVLNNTNATCNGGAC